jgi:hypothetical protein
MYSQADNTKYKITTIARPVITCDMGSVPRKDIPFDDPVFATGAFRAASILSIYYMKNRHTRDAYVLYNHANKWLI